MPYVSEIIDMFSHSVEPVEECSPVPTSIADRYKVGRILGDGNFAVVRECVERSTGREYALKIISKDKCKGKVGILIPLESYQITKFMLICRSLVFVPF